MIAYEVLLNGKTVAVAGDSAMAVLGVMLTAVGVLGPDSAGTHSHRDGVAIDLQVGGVRTTRDGRGSTHVHWVEGAPIRVGDEIIIRVCDRGDADPFTLQEPKVSPDNDKREP